MSDEAPEIPEIALVMPDVGSLWKRQHSDETLIAEIHPTHHRDGHPIVTYAYGEEPKIFYGMPLSRFLLMWTQVEAAA